MKKHRYFFLVSIIIICIIMISICQNRINHIKETNKLTDTNAVTNAPPVVAFTTVALGGFRGLLADILWLRTISLQEQGRYMEMAQIASWISKLQPRFAGANAFLAWNMAYNISITYTKPENKWLWVKNGIDLLRESLKYNPDSPVIYKELAWIYINKIGSSYDSANLYYKTRLALDVEKVLGTGKPDLKYLASLPENKTTLLELDGLKTSLNNFKDQKYNNLNDLFIYFKQQGKLPANLYSKLSKNQIKLLTGYFRVKCLKEEFSLDVKSMYDVSKIFGNLDWRLYQSHAIYWILKAIKASPDTIEYKTILSISLQETAANGTLLLLDKADYNNFTTFPDFTIMNKIKSYYKGQLKKDNSSQNRNIYLSYLQTCIPALYNHEKYHQAQFYFNTMVQEFYKTEIHSANIKNYMGNYWQNYLKPVNKTQALKIIEKQIFLGYLLHASAKKAMSATIFKSAYSIYQKYETLHKNVEMPDFYVIKKKKLSEMKKKLPPDLAKQL